MTLRARQELLARYLDEPDVEQEVRNHPDEMARRHGVPLSFVAWLAKLEPKRVVAFRNSRVHKQAMRDGREPQCLD